MNRSPGEPDFRPTASLSVLRLRAVMLEWVRRFFREHGYWEVETPLLSHDVCVDVWVEPILVEDRSAAGLSPMYLQTSPEFGMKRLLTAGAEAIFQVTRAFRQEEIGRLHNPEFTIVEWYRVGETYHQQMELVEELVCQFREQVCVASREMDVQSATKTSRGNNTCVSLSPPFSRFTYEDAFMRVFGERVLSRSTAELMTLARERGIAAPSSLHKGDRDGWLNLLLVEAVEPMLAEQGAVFLSDYPVSQASLARIRDGETPVAERFELYIEGIEICNGYQELTDPVEFRRRVSEQSERRRQAGMPALPQQSRLLEAMDAGLPECAGVALGFDRLLLSGLGSSSLRDVTAFPIDRA